MWPLLSQHAEIRKEKGRENDSSEPIVTYNTIIANCGEKDFPVLLEGGTRGRSPGVIQALISLLLVARLRCVR